MTEQKTLTPAEALRALAEGWRLKRENWGDGFYIQLLGNHIVSENVSRFIENGWDGWIKCTKPKPKRKVAPYVYQSTYGSIVQTTAYHESEPSVREAYGDVERVIRRVIELEVEVE